jgi:hypothetical protein
LLPKTFLFSTLLQSQLARTAVARVIGAGGGLLRHPAFGIAIALSLLAGGPAHATGLLGLSATADYYVPDLSTIYGSASFTPHSFVIGAGQETTGDVEGVTSLLVDFGNDTLTITLHTTLSSPTWGGASFNGPVFTFAVPHEIASATVDASSTFAGFDDSRVSLTNDEVQLNWQGLSYTDGTQVTIDFGFVPEPATALLLGAGLLGLAQAGRRRARPAS